MYKPVKNTIHVTKIHRSECAICRSTDVTLHVAYTDMNAPTEYWTDSNGASHRRATGGNFVCGPAHALELMAQYLGYEHSDAGTVDAGNPA